jgi:hypothetical protein
MGSYFQTQLLPHLEAIRTLRTDKLGELSLKQQKVGNCVHANWKAALRIAFAFRLWGLGTPLSKAIAEARSLSKRLSSGI